MRILHLISDLDVGGAEVMLYNLVKEHKKMGVDILVVGMTNEGLIGEQINQLGIIVKSLGMKPGFLDFRSLASLEKIVKKFKPDVIQTWMYHADLMGSFISFKYRKIPVVWGLHHTLGGANSLKPSTYRIVKLNSFLSHWLPQKMICCSEATRKSHIKQRFAAEKMLVIRNGIDIGHFQIDKRARLSVRTELGLDSDTPLIGMVARFHPQKNHHSFILAAELIHSILPKVHFILVGKGIQSGNSELSGWIYETGLQEHIHLLGIRTDTARLFAALDIATLSSKFGEALPVSICEAMACGIPCVVTDVGDSRDLVGNTGICVPAGNPKELANGWKKLLSLDAERYSQMGIQARQRIERDYNMLIIANRYYDVYKSVIS